MSQAQPNPDEVFSHQMKAILKPMIDSVKTEKPKDPVIKNLLLNNFCIYKYR